MPTKSAQSRGLYVIAAFKIVKGLALFALGVGALRLLHKDVAAEFERWINLLPIDPHNHYMHELLTRLGILDDRRLRELSFGTFFYSALLLTEGIGLAFRKRWAEYFTIIVTSSLLPLEVFEIVRHATAPRFILLLVNIAVVVYLVLELRRHPKSP
jgi:uncharacterized membrane protein (DUF2068 family)